MSEPKGRGNRQRQQVNQISRRYPTAWAQADALRRDHRKDWPGWCYLPMTHWFQIANPQNAFPSPVLVRDVARLAALGAWRVTQGIYRFDPDLYAALIDTPLTGDLPDELLYRLPSWGVYLETPGLHYINAPLDGVYAHLEHDANSGQPELRLLLDGDDLLSLYSLPIDLGHGSLLDSLRATGDVAKRRMQQIIGLHPAVTGLLNEDLYRQLQHDLAPILSLLLYLCADDADYERPPRLKTARPRALGKQRIAVIPENVRYWDVGARVGAALRTARDAALPSSADQPESTDRAKPQPHGRRAHWHTFWTGPLDSERTAQVKWLPPIAIGLDSATVPTVTP